MRLFVKENRKVLGRAAIVCAFCLSALVAFRVHNETTLKLDIESEASDAINGMLDSVNFGYAIIDQRLHVVMWNPALERMTGWTLADLMGKEIDEVMPAELRQRHRDAMAMALAKKSTNVAVLKCRIIHRTTGEEIPVRVTARIIQSRTGRLFAIAHVDPTSKILEATSSTPLTRIEK